MQTKQIRVRLVEDDIEALEKLASASSLQQIDIARMLLHAALQAVRKEGFTIPFPLEFKIANSVKQKGLK